MKFIKFNRIRMSTILTSLLIMMSISAFAEIDSSVLKGKNILVYTRNGEGFVHDNIEANAAAMIKLGVKFGFKVDVTDQPDVFTDGNLAKYHLIVFANTNNEVFDNNEQRLSFRRYIEAGGGMLGIHSILGTERKWKWFNQLVGGSFSYHPKRQNLYLTKIVKHESTDSVPTHWMWEDECYFSKKYYPGISVLMIAHLDKLDPVDVERAKSHETSFGTLHPVVWYQQFDGGTAWITTLGHNKEAYEDSDFLKHLIGGLEYVASQAAVELDYSKAYATDFDQEVSY